MSTSQSFYELTPEPNDDDEADAGVVDVDGKAMLDGTLNEDVVNSNAADEKAAMNGEVTDDEEPA